MELEVRVVGGVENCFVSLPLKLIETLESTRSAHLLPQVLSLELRSRSNQRWVVAWSGATSSSSFIEVNRCATLSFFFYLCWISNYLFLEALVSEVLPIKAHDSAFCYEIIWCFPDPKSGYEGTYSRQSSLSRSSYCVIFLKQFVQNHRSSRDHLSICTIWKCCWGI